MSGFEMSLKCDEPDCDVKIACPDYGPQYIDTPCPECGANLLTEKDFEDAEPFRLLMVQLHAAGIAKSPDKEGGGVLLNFNQHKGKTRIELSNPAEGGDT